jgi:hypothetical protein
MRRRWIGRVVAIAAVFAVGVGLGAAQRAWTMAGKSSGRSPSSGDALVARPQASIVGPANGLYCTPATDNGVGVHDLGGIPAGLRVTVTVDSYNTGFDPVAAVIGATMGLDAGDNVRTVTFYDNDSGGEKDSRIEFVTPQSGNYFLLVGDYPDAVTGCYRYEVAIR